MTVLSVEWWLYDDDLQAIKVHALISQPPADQPILHEAIITMDQAHWPKREVKQVDWLNDYRPEWTLIKILETTNK